MGWARNGTGMKWDSQARTGTGTKWDGHEMAGHEMAGTKWFGTKWPGTKWDIPEKLFCFYCGGNKSLLNKLKKVKLRWFFFSLECPSFFCFFLDI